MQLSPHALSITLLFWIAASAPPTWACDDLDPGFGDEPTVGEIQRYTDCLWSEHRLGDLIIFLESNLDAVKNDAWLTRMLGMAYNTHGRTEEARQMLTHAYSLSPEDPVINEALAQVLTVRALQISPR